MKRCPTCNRTYADLSLNFCLDDGTPLTTDAATTADLNATIRYPAPRDTSEPPPTEIYRPTPAAPPPPPQPPRPTSPPPQQQQQAQTQWAPTPALPPKKSNAIWWILGVFMVLIVIGAGLVVMLLVIANMDSKSAVRISNVNNNNSNVSANTNANANANANANVGPPSSLVDDFSQPKWNTATSQYGKTWYLNDEYHMSSKEQTFIVMYAPSNDYSTENATVKVTARSVNGSVPSAGFGLMVHCLQSRSGKLEDYALLIYPSDEPEYQIVMHKAGEQTTLVDRTKSNAIKSGSEPNELQVRIKGAAMTFLVNGKVLTQLNDKENYRKGRVGFYTSDVFEVSFDDLSIERTP
jgi:hypothetical protein